MEEFVIPVYSEENFPYILLSRYPIAIRTDVRIPDTAQRHDLPKMATAKMIDVPDLDIDKAMRYRPVKNEGVVVPRLLDITLRAYDQKKKYKTAYGSEFVTNSEWLRWAIEDRMDVQPMRVVLDPSSAVEHQLFNCVVKVKPANADTVYYDYHPLERKDKQCNHSNLELLRSLIATEQFHVIQGAAYCLKSNYNLTVHNERERVGEDYAIGEQRQISLVRGARIENKGNSYQRFMAGLVQVVVRGRVPDSIAGEIESINQIRQRWMRASYSRSEIRSLELCKLLSTIGRKMVDTHEEPKDESDLSLRFQFKLDEKFTTTDSEYRNIFNTGGAATNEGRFYALIMIAATDTQEGRIWRTNPYPCLRGALVAAECEMGDVYFTLRHVYNWSVRHSYGLGERDLENNKYVFQRINLFDSLLGEGEQVMHWQYELDDPVQTTYDNGYVCRAREDRGELTCQISEDEYQAMINSARENGWDQEGFKLHSILTGPNLLTIDFERDAYLNARSELVMPGYFNKWIDSPMFSCRLRITHGEIRAGRREDPWHKRVNEGFLSTPTESQECVLGRFYDQRLMFFGSTLAHQQHQSQVFDYISSQKDFEALTGCTKRDDICPHSGGALYILRRTALSIISYYERLDPEMHIGREHETYIHPSALTDHLERVAEMEDFSQAICYVIDTIFEKRNQLRSRNEARWILHRIQFGVEHHRIQILSEQFPKFWERVRRLKDVRYIYDLNVINFFPLIFLVQDNIAYMHRQWSVPMILFDDVIRLVPVEVGAYANRFGLRCFFSFIRFHPGDSYKKQTANDVQKELGVICYRYYLATRISQGGIDIPIVTTKLDILRMHLATLCGGITDAVVYTLPVAHPEKCIVLIIIGDDKMKPHTRSELVLSRYYFSKKHVRGTLSVCLDQSGGFKVSSTGIVRHRVCDKTILKYKCSVILVKTPGYVFGNDELMTKLLNV
uniref:Outer capsid protein VP2 n=1 Tax=Bluetongue virus TaxID=40051 RepID=A0A514C9N7_BTV|nr:VP2 [Bluetongue virus]QGW56806.1 VP2 protein [Bluetongue virus]